MRIVVKGGVWKNSEDELIKAAVMKYGLNQWARVASLLPRKTAKQVKARWHEWLDPSIKKTEWTREEEERLLHLAKLMPAQWRTIAPLVGRTASQCIEHYEKLLDAAAAAKDGGKPAADPRDDPRRLRPGEIDPAPEVKPARPDPVDMDEDEKEMLSEARARLANSQGKKSKRKARERMLEDARRLARLQKARELKAAGIDVSRRKRRREDGIDLAEEIPYWKTAPAGFHDTAMDDERLRAEKAAETDAFKVRLLSDVERSRVQRDEARERAQDKARLRRQAAADLPAVLAAEAAEDPLNLRKRPKLNLPAPILSETELHAVMKAGADGAAAASMLEDVAGSVVTSALLNDGDGAATDITASLTSLAAARAAQRGLVAPIDRRKAIEEEARNQAAMQHETNPLLGGENVVLERGTGYGGVGLPSATPTPGSAARAMRTPVPGTPAIGDAASVVDGGVPAVHPSARLRDPMRINADDGATFDDAASEAGPSASVATFATQRSRRTMASKADASAVALSLASLPKPKGGFDVVPAVLAEEPMDLIEPDRGTSATVPDAAEDDAAAMREQQEIQERLLRQRSAVLQHPAQLPRPLVLDDDAIAPSTSEIRASLRRLYPADTDEELARRVAVEALLSDELLQLLKSDASVYPVPHPAFQRPKHAIALDAVPEEELAAARALVANEYADMQLQADLPEVTRADVEAATAALASSVYVPSKRMMYTGGPLAPEDAPAVAAALRSEVEHMRSAFDAEAARIAKLEARLQLLTKGYEARVAKLYEGMRASVTEGQTRAVELLVLRSVAAQERETLPKRAQALAAQVAAFTQVEQQLQERYAQNVRVIEATRAAFRRTGLEIPT